MGSLSNLYISQSYQSLLHFSTDNSASAALTMLQDGVGQNLYTYVNTNGDLLTSHSISSSIIEATNLIIKDKIEVTGSIDINASVTASNAFIENDLIVSGTLYAFKIVTTTESASIIFSSGSNILGDTTADTQTLIGSVIISGSQSMTGSVGITGEVSSSTIAGLGNATTYSASVQSFITNVSSSISGTISNLSQSVDNRLDQLEAFTASTDAKFNSLQTTTASLNQFTQSTNADLSSIHSTTASLNQFSASALITASAVLNTITFTKGDLSTFNVTLAGTTFDTGAFTTTASFQAYTASNDSKVNQLINATSSYAISSSVAAAISGLSSSVYTSQNNLSTSIQLTDTAQTTRIDALASFTGSYATTGSNTFRGNQSITGSLQISGSMVYSGSVRGVVIPLTINSSTASMDCSLGNFFTLTLVSGSATHLTATNINSGETIGLRITQPVGGYGSVTYSGALRFPQAFPYIATPSGSAIDILSFQSYDTSTLYGVGVNTMR